MFEYLKDLRNEEIEKKSLKIKLDTIKDGVNLFDDYIIIKKQKIKVFDRICDHNGGKIISRDNEHFCPMHNWKFNPINGQYNNGLKKKEKKFDILNDCIVIEEKKYRPKITSSNKKIRIKIRFFNHAFISIETQKFKFATDPWAIGPAFNSGWWLKNKTKSDWINELNSCSFIYISHNHPDHLHPLSLSKIKKDMPMIVPNFSSDSTGSFIESLGFRNIYRLDFLKEYKFKDTDLILSLLKSGDFRDDSGIYFSIGEFTSLFDVDSNIINFNKLPNVNLYASSFAGGASGYPLMFDNYSIKERKQIIKKDLSFSKLQKFQMIKKINPNYFLPYAGFFEEKLERDKRVKKLNKKNQIEDYKKVCKTNKTKLLNVLENDEYLFQGINLIQSAKNKKKYFKDLPPTKYLKFFKKNYDKIDINYIKKYFEKSKFYDNLILYISLTNDDFSKSEFNFSVNFSTKQIKFQIVDKINLKDSNKNRVLYLKCRKESFLNTIYNKAPWEDLSIGFQCKILRFPNMYNLKFWYHFTNEYTSKKNIRFSSNCGKCEKLSDFFNSLEFKKTKKVNINKISI